MTIFEDLEKDYIFPKGYGKFPYILLKSYHAMFVQVQIKMLHDRLIKPAQYIYNKTEKDKGNACRLWLVEDENTAYDFDKGKIKRCIKLPSEETLLNQSYQPIKMSGKHYDKNN
jgi:hypothetical protein